MQQQECPWHAPGTTTAVTCGTGGSEGLGCDSFQEAEVTHSDPPLRRNHFTALRILKERHSKIFQTKDSTSDPLSGSTATNCQLHHLKESLAQQSLLLLLSFLLCAQELSQGRSCRKTEGKSCTEEPPTQCKAVSKVLRARMKGRSNFKQHKEKSELVQVFQAQKEELRTEKEARTEEPSPGFGDSKDAGLVLTVC